MSEFQHIKPAGQPRKNSAGRRFRYSVLVLMMTQPYLHWFGVGLPSTVQPYPTVAAALFLAHSLLGAKEKDPLLETLLAASIPVVILQLVASVGPISATIRGVFGYASLGIQTWAWVWLIRSYGIELLTRLLKVMFWIWFFLGLVQLADRSLGTLWRSYLVVTNDRGVVSFATEPAYFSYALLFMSLAILLLQRDRKYLVFATAGTVLLAQSGIGTIYCVVALLLVSQATLGRKLALLVGGLLGWLIAAPALEGTRLTKTLTGLVTDPFSLFSSDQSSAIRYDNIVNPIQAFFSNWGLPHGVSSVGGGSQEFGEETRILSIHGQLLYELGLYAIVFYLLFWLLIRNSPFRWSLAGVGCISFFNGITLNSPFLALLLAAAYVASRLGEFEGAGKEPEPLDGSFHAKRQFGNYSDPSV